MKTKRAIRVEREEKKENCSRNISYPCQLGKYSSEHYKMSIMCMVFAFNMPIVIAHFFLLLFSVNSLLLFFFHSIRCGVLIDSKKKYMHCMRVPVEYVREVSRRREKKVLYTTSHWYLFPFLAICCCCSRILLLKLVIRVMW